MSCLDQYEIDESGCWIWSGPVDHYGYGKISYNGATRSAYRVLYELMVGPVPDGRELDHLCHSTDRSCVGGVCPHRRCVNPAHLEPVTHAENMARSSPATKTHCINGHPFTEANTYIRPYGRRDCRRCIVERVTRYRLRKRVAA